MHRDMKNPISIREVEELKQEIANELAFSNMEAANSQFNAEINKKLVERYRNNLIGFK